MIESKFKLGFIGGGLNSAIGQTHKISAQMDGRWELVAGCFSRNHDTNIKTAEAWGVDASRVYASWQEFLTEEKGKIDAVVILTPIPSHSDIVIESLNQGFAVICEKALTPSSEEAALVRKAVEKNKGFLIGIYNYTGYPMLRELKMMIEKGRLGKVNQIHVEMPSDVFIKVDKNGNAAIPQKWRLSDGRIATISLDLGAHLHHIVHFLTNERPIEVVALNNSFGSFNQIVDNTICIARYSNNLSCNIWFSKSALGHRNGLRVRVYGDQGSAEWFQMEPESLTFTDKQGYTFLLDRAVVNPIIAAEARYHRFKSGHPAGFIEAFANHYFDIADCLEEYKKSGKFDSPWVFTVEPIEEGLLMLEAIGKSAESKRWETVIGKSER